MDFIIEQPRKINIVHECDVLVAGGGIAGISAALAATRAGAKVTLLEKEFVLGGLATLGLIAIYLPLCDGMGNQVSFGISEELLRLSVKFDTEPECPEVWLENGSREERTGKRFRAKYNPHIFAISCEQLLIKEGVKIIYGTSVCGVDMDNNRINAVIIENKSGRAAVRVKSVVDTTGDADICKLANARTEIFKQKNVLAAWYYFVKEGKLHLNGLGAADIPDNQKDAGSPKPLIDRRFEGLDGIELSEMVIKSHEFILKDVLGHMKTKSSFYLAAIPAIPQLRMTRRLCGCYTLDDSEERKNFDDSIGVISNWRKCGPVYEIPYRTLYGEDVVNLITAGRSISATDSMWDITRVIPACAVTGEAAGAAAAMTDKFHALDIRKLQKHLVSNGVKLNCRELV